MKRTHSFLITSHSSLLLTPNGQSFPYQHINKHLRPTIMRACRPDHHYIDLPQENTTIFLTSFTFSNIDDMPKRLTLEEIQQIARSRGGRCLSKEYKDCRTKMKWECSVGHVWETKARYVTSGCWCPYCGPRAKINLISMQAIARSRGGKCISKEVIWRSDKLRWKCAKGHVWEARPQVVRLGHWCPECTNERRNSLEKYTMKELRHMAEVRGGRLLSRKYVNATVKMQWQCSKGHTWTATAGILRMGVWCPYCSSRKKRTIKDMQALAKRRGGECVSIAYIDPETPLKWRCAKGHKWRAAPMNISHGTWCRKCAYESKKLTLKDMQDFAKERGGKCLSKRYSRPSNRLKWQCAKGHVFRLAPRYLRATYRWCPTCEGRQYRRSTKHMARIRERSKD